MRPGRRGGARGLGMPDAGRVIAGSARGRRLLHPGTGTRPFADRVKQAIFGMLAPVLADARVADLFAGSGAGGIEALSRGAASCDFVEREPAAVRVIEENLRRTGLAGPAARVHRSDVAGFLSRGGGPWDIVLLDPPFGDAAILAVLAQLGDAGSLAPGALVVARHFWRDEMPERAGRLVRQRERRIGEGVVTVYRAEPVAADTSGQGHAPDGALAAPADRPVRAGEGRIVDGGER